MCCFNVREITNYFFRASKDLICVHHVHMDYTNMNEITKEYNFLLATIGSGSCGVEIASHKPRVNFSGAIYIQ